MTLAEMLNSMTDKLVTDERSRSDIISEMADAAGIEVGTVNQILRGDITEPPDERLEGFAKVLGGSADKLKKARGDKMTKQAMSLTDRIEMIAAQLRQKFKKSGTDDSLYWYPKEVFEDSLITASDMDSKLYRISYSIEGEEVTFGEPEQVEEEYVPVAQETELVVGSVSQAVEPEGWVWRVQICQFGLSANRHLWTQEFFDDTALAALEGIRAFADHPTDEELEERPERSVRNVVGWYSNFVRTSQGVDADFHIKNSADWLRRDIKGAFDQGNKNLYGFSVFLLTRQTLVKWADGKPAIKHLKLLKSVSESIDVVTEPAAGGRIKHALASARGRKTTEGAKPNMNKELLMFLFRNKERFAFVRQSLVDKGAEGVTVELNEEQLADVIIESDELVAQAVELIQQRSEESLAAAPQRTQAEGDSSTPISFGQLPVELRTSLIAQALRDSQLPEAAQALIRNRVGSNATMADVQTQIELTRETLALTSQSGDVRNNGRGGQVGANSLDKITMGLAKAFELTRDQYASCRSEYEETVQQSGRQYFRPGEGEWNDVPPIHSIRRLYTEMTGDWEFRGRAARRSTRLTGQAQTPWAIGDFGDLLSNLMHKKLIAGYREVDFGLDRVVTPAALQDFKEQQIIVLGYFGDLSSVNENAEYTTFAALSDDKEVYTPTKRGNTVDLGIEAIANDDLRGIRRAPDLMGRSARRTLAKAVWNTNLFNNPTLGQDSKALFHADHNNLITDALGTTGLANAINLLLRQTEPGSGEAFSFNTSDLTLAVRSDLLLTAISLTDFNQEPGGNIDALARLIRRSDSRLGITPVAIPFLSDANDWILAANRSEADIVEVGYWQGMQEPEFFTMDSETHEKAFNNDIIVRWKVRFIFGAKVVDFRPVVKSVVAG